MNLLTVRIVLPAGYGHLEESTSWKEVQFQKFCPPVKTSVHPNENINEIPCRFVIFIVPDLLKCSSLAVVFFF